MPRPVWTKSLRFQLTGWYLVTLTAILVPAAVLLLGGLRAALLHGTDQILAAEADRIAQALAPPTNETDEGDERPDPASVLARSSVSSLTVTGVVTDALFVRLARSDSGTTVALSPDLRPQPRLIAALAAAPRPPSGRSRLSFIGPDEESRMRCLSLALPQTPFWIQVATPWDHTEDLMTHLAFGLSLALGVFLVLSAVGSWLLVGRALRPMDEIVTEAERLTAERLTPTALRPRTLSDNEVGHLVVALNGMLARLHAAFTAQRQFTADASHELRTPLTILQGEMETALSRERTDEEYRRVLESGLEETRRMARIVDSLGFLARGDARPADTVLARRVPVHLGELASEVAASLMPQAEQKGLRLTLHTDAEAIMEGDPDALRRAVRNLLDNAIRYTPPGGEIRLAVEAGLEECRLHITDTGSGIPTEDLPHVFDRFYRGDKARVNDGGSGLGLAIVQRISAEHNGRIEVESSPGVGSRFTLALPRD